MITSNTSIPFIKAENSENKFYLSRLTSEYNEGDSITTSTDINCRKLAIAIKAGDKITINGTSLTVYADAAVDATSFFVEEITLDEALNINANIAIDEDNMFVQYQRKTEGTVAGFDIDADGMSKGGVEITGWLDSDTMEGATENNIPTAQSVKAYVDTQVGASDTLQEVTDNGNTTTNSIMIGSSSSPEEKLSVSGSIQLTNQQELTWADIGDGNTGRVVIRGNEDADWIMFKTDNSERMRLTNTGLGIGTTAPTNKLSIKATSSSQAVFGIQYSSTTTNFLEVGVAAHDSYLTLKNSGTTEVIKLNSDGDSYFNGGDVGIGTTPGYKLHVYESTANNVLKLESGSSKSQVLFTNSNSTDTVVVGSNNDNMLLRVDNGHILFNTSNTGASNESMRITSAGNVGIGTTSPASKLHVAGTVQVGVDDAGHDVKFFGATSGEYMLWDESEDALRFTDNTQLRLGIGNDLRLWHNGTNSYVFNYTGNLYIGAGEADKDTIFLGDNGTGGETAYLTLDGGLGYTTVQKEMRFDDSTAATFGASGDLQISHNGSSSSLANYTGNFFIQNQADDGDIIFKSDDGSGGLATYLTLDGSQETVNVYKNLLIGTTTDSGYKLDVNGTQRVQDVLELDDVLTLNAISTPDDPDEGKSSIYMDSADGAIKVKINFEGEVVTRTIASFDG